MVSKLNADDSTIVSPITKNLDPSADLVWTVPNLVQRQQNGLQPL